MGIRSRQTERSAVASSVSPVEPTSGRSQNAVRVGRLASRTWEPFTRHQSSAGTASGTGASMGLIRLLTAPFRRLVNFSLFQLLIVIAIIVVLQAQDDNTIG